MRLETTSTGVIALMVGAVSNCADAVRLETAPTGPGKNIELPNYFLKPHLGSQSNRLWYKSSRSYLMREKRVGRPNRYQKYSACRFNEPMN